MPKSVFTDAYASLLEALVALRKKKGMTQVELSKRLGKPQPFISYIERGERRIDVIEFYAITRALGADPVEVFAALAKKLPRRVDI
ncbi:MAG TPA: XRE family transcriptional regulator [Hyphomonadaceae bacterium]|nr:XRE family transcriptional regulator [Hyphomonadaceae bacterium]